LRRICFDVDIPDPGPVAGKPVQWSLERSPPAEHGNLAHTTDRTDGRGVSEAVFHAFDEETPWPLRVTVRDVAFGNAVRASVGELLPRKWRNLDVVLRLAELSLHPGITRFALQVNYWEVPDRLGLDIELDTVTRLDVAEGRLMYRYQAATPLTRVRDDVAEVRYGSSGTLSVEVGHESDECASFEPGTPGELDVVLRWEKSRPEPFLSIAVRSPPSLIVHAGCPDDGFTTPLDIGWGFLGLAGSLCCRAGRIGHLPVGTQRTVPTR
jgi:hypothetical protein